MTRITKDDIIGDIASDVPSAMEIFRQHGIDFCCGGGRKLEDAVSDSNADINGLLSELNRAAEADDDRTKPAFKKMSGSELIRHILDRHHGFMRKALPEIYGLSVTVLRAHGRNHGYLFDLHRLFGNLRNEIDAHLIKEEELLFPEIRRAENDPSHSFSENFFKLLNETENEHDAAGTILKEMREITDGYLLPADACGTFAALFSKMEEMERDLHQHVHLENNILFRRIS